MSELGNKILINVEDDETRIALLNGENLQNLNIEQNNRAQKVGNIYCGKVVKIQPSFQAAFIDYGEERHGFLSISDINFQVYKPNRNGRGRSSISQVLKIGQKVLVQVIKDEISHKGASLTTNISIPGRFLVFIPDSDRGGVSKKIEDEEQRNRLRHLLTGLGSENSSAIIRTVGVDRSLSELKRDFTVLRKTWIEIKNNYELESNPKLLYKEEDAMLRMIRDYFNETVSEVIIDDPMSFQIILEFFQTYLPNEQKKLKLYLGEKSLFNSHMIESQIEILDHKEVPLPSGGSLVIMPTEALVAIDVNSGKSTQEKNVEDTALRTNLEAAEEISRQLRLRNLGGLIVVDFIDMENSKNRILVEKKIEESMALDKAKTSFGMISKFGLLELSRQRISSSLFNNSSTITLANRILRKIHDTSIEEKLLQVEIKLPLNLSSHLLNNKRQLLSQMEIDNGIKIIISPEIRLTNQDISDMELTIQEKDNSVILKTIPISSLKNNEDKRDQKKDKIKKVDGKKLKSNSELKIVNDSFEKNIQNEKNIKKNFFSKKTKDLKESTEKKPKVTSLSDYNDKKESKSLKKDSKKKDSYGNIKKEMHEELNEKNSGTIFNSSHESDDVSEKEGIIPSNSKNSLEKNNTSFSFESRHLKIKKEEAETSNSNSSKKITENLSEKTPLYTSVHLNDIYNTKKKFSEDKKKSSKNSLDEKKEVVSKPLKNKSNSSISKKEVPKLKTKKTKKEVFEVKEKIKNEKNKLKNKKKINPVSTKTKSKKFIESTSKNLDSKLKKNNSSMNSK